MLDVVADRFRLGSAEKVRVMEAIELALKRGSGRLNVLSAGRRRGGAARAVALLHRPALPAKATCATPTRSRRCSASTRPSAPARPAAASAASSASTWAWSFPTRARRCATAPSRRCRRPPGPRCQDDLLKYAGEAGIPRDTPWAQLTPAQHDWVIDGSPELERQVEQAVVRHPALLRVPGEQGLQDAHPRAAVEVPQLHAVPRPAAARG